MKPVRDRIIKWNFCPQQSEIYLIIVCLNVSRVVPGETALAFYRAWNPTDKPVIGISTYNVVPFECFCFEEQMLNPHEEVDMPVFFYIDPECDDDPRMARRIPIPGYS
uniref:Cytochrome c oxidase assembly homolog 11 (yeast) n=1 Tax=Cyprinus carpio TaxID=7962 RepID=A0A8C1ZDF7_CYPCA